MRPLNKILILVSLSIVISSCKTLTPIPPSIDLDISYSDLNQEYKLITMGPKTFAGLRNNDYGNNYQLSNGFYTQYSNTHGVAGGVAAGLVAGLLVAAEQENYFRKVEYFINPIVDGYKERNLSAEQINKVIAILEKQSWLVLDKTSRDISISDLQKIPHVKINSTRQFTNDFRGVQLETTVEVYHPKSIMNPELKDFRLKPIFKRSVIHKSPLLDEPIKTQDVKDEAVKKIKADFNQLPPKKRRDPYQRALKNEKLSKARRSVYTQEERSDILRNQWMANDFQLLNNAIKFSQDKTIAEINNSLLNTRTSVSKKEQTP